jgi:heme/copper-type cytochrome/quinol oxidase subunit 2
MRTTRTALMLVALAALAHYAAPDAAAQCALCRTAVQGAGEAAARTMNLAILVLLVPPVAIFCAIFAVAFRRRDGGDDEMQ